MKRSEILKRLEEEVRIEEEIVRLERLLAIKEARSSFFCFLKLMFPNKAVTWNWHHEYVCDLLQEFVVGDIDNLMIFMPPQHQKSTMMTEYLPAWNFGINPNAESLLIMYNATMAAKYNRKIQRVIDNDLYREIFPETRLNDKNVVTTSKGAYTRNSEEFQIVGYRGFLKATGVGGGIAGNPAKFTFMDDVIKNAEEANSKRYRDKTYEWQTDELEARQHNDSKIAFTITRRHEDDLAGRLIERDGKIEDGGKWTVVVLPALKEDDSNPNDPREIGEALFPELHSRERMEEIRDKKPRTFASLYQQRPAPIEGGIIKDSFIEIVNPIQMPTAFWGLQKFFVADLAYTAKEENDPTGVLCFKVYQNILYIIDFVKYRERFEGNKGRIIEFMGDKHDSIDSPIWIENKAGGLDMTDSLVVNYGINAIPFKVGSSDKTARLMSIINELYAGRIKILSGWDYKNFMSQLKVFPNGSHDEEVDCLVMAAKLGLQGVQGGDHSTKIIGIDL